MRRVVLLALLALALPVAAFATSYDYSNTAGTITTNSSGGLTATSFLTAIAVNGVITQAGSDLGTVSIVTGPIAAGGSLTNGGTLGPGTILITPAGGGAPLFSQTFTSATWTLVPQMNGQNQYILTAQFSNGNTFQTSGFITGFFSGSAKLASGDTFVQTVPEPGTLGLLGTGLVGIAGLVRRKLKS